MADLPQLAKMLLEMSLSWAVPLPARSGADDGEDAGVVAAADEVLGDDEMVAGVDEDAGTGASSLAGRAGLGVADVPDDVVVDLVELRFISMWTAALTVRTSAKILPVMRQLALPLSNQTALAWRMWRMTLRRKSMLWAPWNLAPAASHPRSASAQPHHSMRLSSIESVAGSHAAEAFDAAVADGVAADDLAMRRPGRCGPPSPVAVADVEADAVGPFDGVVFDDPVIAAGGGDHAALRNRVTVAGVLEGDSLDADVSQGPYAKGAKACSRVVTSMRWSAGVPEARRMWMAVPEFSTQNLASGEPPISCMMGPPRRARRAGR